MTWAIFQIMKNPTLSSEVRRLMDDRKNGVTVSRGSDLEGRGGGFTSPAYKNRRGGNSCDSAVDGEGHHNFVKSLGPGALEEDDFAALIAHELGHAYSNLYGGDGDTRSIDWENALRSGPSRPYSGGSDGTSWHSWPR